MALINNNYFKSENVKVFPCSFRGQNGQTIYDPEARLHTEYNLTHISSSLKDSYVISFKNIEQDQTKPANYTLICVIGGYHFEINNIAEADLAIYNSNNELTDTKTLFIITRKAKIMDGVETDVLNCWVPIADSILDNEGAFLGIYVGNNTSKTTYTAKLKPCIIVEGKLALDRSKLLPEIEHGSGINTVVQKAIIEGDPATANEATKWWAAAFGQSNKSLNYSSFTTGTRNTNNGDSAFIAGADNEVKDAGLFSIVGGDNNSNEGRSSLVVGEKNTVTSGGRDSIICGGNNQVDAASSVVGGRDNIAYTNYSLAVGEHLVTNWKNKHVVGVYNDDSETDMAKLFSVGNGGDNKQIAQAYDIIPNSGNQHTFNSEIDLSEQSITISIKISGGNCRFRLFNNIGTYTLYFTILPEGKLRDQIPGVSYETLSDKTCVLSITSLNIQTIKGIKFDTGYSPATGTLAIQYLGLVRSNALEVYDNGNVSVANGLTVNTIQSDAIQVNNTITADTITVNTVNANNSLTASNADLTSLSADTASITMLTVNDTFTVDKITANSDNGVAIDSTVTTPVLNATTSMTAPKISTNEISSINNSITVKNNISANDITITADTISTKRCDTDTLYIANRPVVQKDYIVGMINVPANQSTYAPADGYPVQQGTGYVEYYITNENNIPVLVLKHLYIRSSILQDNQGTQNSLKVKFYFSASALLNIFKKHGFYTNNSVSEFYSDWMTTTSSIQIKYDDLPFKNIKFARYVYNLGSVDYHSGLVKIPSSQLISSLDDTYKTLAEDGALDYNFIPNQSARYNKGLAWNKIGFSKSINDTKDMYWCGLELIIPNADFTDTNNNPIIFTTNATFNIDLTGTTSNIKSNCLVGDGLEFELF